jgi:hypothetical protein
VTAWQSSVVSTLSGVVPVTLASAAKYRPISGSAYFRSAPQVGDSTSNLSPLQFFGRVAFRRTIHFELFGMHNGRFHPQDTARFVIGLKRIAVDRVPDAQAFGPVFERAANFTLESVGLGPSQKAEHVGTGKTSDGVMDKLRIKTRQRRGIFEQEIRGELCLVGAPIIFLTERLAQFPVQRMRLIQKRIEHRFPIRMQLLVEQPLRCSGSDTQVKQLSACL